MATEATPDSAVADRLNDNFLPLFWTTQGISGHIVAVWQPTFTKEAAGWQHCLTNYD